MYTLLFALVAAVSAWSAWHNSPLYSNRATLRFVLVVGLAVAAVLSAVIAAVQLTSGRSDAVTFTTLGVVLLFGTMTLIWVIVTVSTPKVAALSPTTKLVRVHRAMLEPWVRRFGWTLLALAVLAVVVPGDGKFLVYGLAVLVGYLGIILLFTGYIAALNVDRSLTAVETNPWVRWTYGAEEWAAWVFVEVARARAQPPQWSWRADWKRLALPLLAVAAGVFVFDPGTWVWKATYVVVVSAAILGLAALGERSQRSAPERLRRRLLKAPPETYFGADGVFAGGVYTQWRTVTNYLLDASLDERQPRSLALTFEKVVPGAYGSASTEIRQDVLVPPGAEADLAKLQASLAATCPSARVALARTAVVA